MNIETFGYRGNFVFQNPLIIENQNKNLMLIATPYGRPDDLENCLNDFLNEFESQSVDLDSTSAYPKLTCFNDHENLLYTCIQFLNDNIYSNFNRNILTLGCDLFCLYKQGSILYFAQLGWPLVLLNRDKKNIPISADYASLPKNKNEGAYLPSHLLGLESSINLKIQQINTTKKSELLLIKSNESPDSLMSLYPCSLREIANVYAEENPQQGFWMGKISDL